MAGVFITLREKFSWLLLGFIIVALLLFVFSEAIQQVFSQRQGDRTTVGVVAGETIGIAEFQEAYKNASSQATQQGRELDDDLKRQVLDQTWNGIIQTRLDSTEYKSVGLEISDRQLEELMLGANPDPALSQIRQFQNQQGQYDPAIVRYAYGQKANPEVATFLKQVEQYVVQTRLSNLYNKGISSLMLVSDARVAQQVQLDKEQRSAQYLAVSYGAIADSAVTLTDNDYDAYYRENKERFKQKEPLAELAYVVFLKASTKEDTALVLKELNGYMAEFASTETDSVFAALKTDLPADKGARFQAKSSLPEDVIARIAGKNPGELIGPYLEGNYYKVTKVAATKTDSLSSAKIKHIFLQFKGATAADTAATQRLADSLAKVTTKENFGGLAAQFSDDQQSRFQGGELGWLPRGVLGNDFDKALSNAPTGKVIGPLKSTAGYHVVEVLEKDNQLIRLATISKEIYAGSATLENLDRKAQELNAKFEELKDLGAAAKELNLDVITSQPITPSSMRIAGLQGTGELTSWALIGKKDDRTGVRSLDNAFLVGYISKKQEEGYRPLADVKEEIQVEVLNRKKAQMIMTKLGKGPFTDLEAAKTAYGDGAYVAKAENVTFSSGVMAGVGNDRTVVGTLFGLKEGQVSAPLRGNNGVYVLKLTNVTPVATPIADADLKTTRGTLEATANQQLPQRLQEGLRAAADVRDYRFKFPW